MPTNWKPISISIRGVFISECFTDGVGFVRLTLRWLREAALEGGGTGKSSLVLTE